MHEKVKELLGNVLNKYLSQKTTFPGTLLNRKQTYWRINVLDIPILFKCKKKIITYPSPNLPKPHHQTSWDFYSSWSCIEWWSGGRWKVTGDRWQVTGYGLTCGICANICTSWDIWWSPVCGNFKILHIQGRGRVAIKIWELVERWQWRRFGSKDTIEDKVARTLKGAGELGKYRSQGTRTTNKVGEIGQYRMKGS